jgi:prepilin-type N-terminal cleavage/methylation domain-containing protein
MRGTKGFSLVEVSVATVAGAALMAAVAQSLAYAQKGAKGMSESADMVELGQVLRVLLFSEGSCEKTGLVGTSLSPLFARVPRAVDVQIHQPGPAGPGPVRVAAGLPFGGRKVKRAAIQSAVPIGVAEARIFLSNLVVQTTSAADAKLGRTRQRDVLFYARLRADDSIASCWIEGPAPPSTQPIACTEVNVPFIGAATGTTSWALCPSTYPKLRGVRVSQESRADDTDVIRTLRCCQ